MAVNEPENKPMRRFYHSVTVPDHRTDTVLQPVPDGCVRFVIHNRNRRTISYTTLLADHTAKERVYRGVATVDDKIEALPTMTPKELSESGLSWAFVDGKFVDGAENFLRETHAHWVNALHARRGTQYIFDTVRTITGAESLAYGTQQELALYGALLDVTLASAEIEKIHDPEAVHMTPEIAAVVAANVNRKDAIIRYIKERNMIIRDIDPQHLEDYVTTIHSSVSEGFL